MSRRVFTDEELYLDLGKAGATALLGFLLVLGFLRGCQFS